MLNKAPKPVEKWGLDKRALKIVKKNLNLWLEHFKSFSDAPLFNNKLSDIHRCDFLKMDFFYFTNCQTLVSKEIEMKGTEKNQKIRWRKDAKLLAMYLATLLSENFIKKNACSHCGYDNRFINGFEDGSGHYLVCPKCGYTTIGTYPPFYDKLPILLKKDLEEHGIKF
jgi:hypothetical protein